MSELRASRINCSARLLKAKLVIGNERLLARRAKREWQHVGHHAHFSCELERVLPAAVVDQLDKERRESARGFAYSAYVLAGLFCLQRSARVSVADRVNSEVASLGIGRLPQI